MAYVRVASQTYVLQNISILFVSEWMRQIQEVDSLDTVTEEDENHNH